MFFRESCLRTTGNRSAVLLGFVCKLFNHLKHFSFLYFFLFMFIIFFIFFILLFANIVRESYFLELLQLTPALYLQYTTTLAGARITLGFVALANDFKTFRFASNLLTGKIWERVLNWKDLIQLKLVSEEIEWKIAL